ncbi:MAG TPA: helix-turn-helix transcriptional regulator, partial [Ktedonobacteraceae bacterium]|nr:helix-turn-helix transcriptional regulator [Ktedonobacteraceae bacterium]
MEWNERLRQARKSRRWTQDVLAEQLGTNRSTISRWEKGNDFPYPIHREKLTELLGAIFDDVEASAIYRDKDPKPSVLVSEGEQVHYEYCEHCANQTLSTPG